MYWNFLLHSVDYMLKVWEMSSAFSVRILSESRIAADGADCADFKDACIRVFAQPNRLCYKENIVERFKQVYAYSARFGYLACHREQNKADIVVFKIRVIRVIRGNL